MSRVAWERFFLFSWERLEGVSGKLLPLVKLYRWIWIWNLYQSCLHCAIPKSWYPQEAHKTKDMQFFLENVQNDIFKILKMFKNNMKFTRATCWINSKISNSDKNTALMIFLLCHYCWSLIWENCWRSLMLWNLLKLKLFKVNCSNTAWSSSMRPIFDK